MLNWLLCTIHQNTLYILYIMAKINICRNNSLTLHINLYIIKINQERLIKYLKYNVCGFTYDLQNEKIIRL